MIPFGVRNTACATIALLLVACQWDKGTVPMVCHAPPPDVVSTEVTPNAHNVLAALVTTKVRFADSVAVRFGSTAGRALDNSTPARRLNGFEQRMDFPVLGLRPSQDYSVRVDAYNRCGVTSGDVQTFTTAALPADLPSYAAGGADPSPGYVVFAAGSYGIVIDNSGRVVWYRKFANGPGLNFQAQPNGRYTARPTPATPSEPAQWLEIDVLGNVTRTLGCARELPSRVHEFLAEPDGAYWLLCDETRTLDLSPTGGAQNARVTATTIQHLSAEGNLLFEWSAFDHFDIDYLAIDPADRAGATINWTHGNAFDLDSDGNLLMSFRNLNEVTKIDTHTGDVIWRMGGKANQFQFGDVAAAPFARQHGLRATATGQIVLLDNLGDPIASHAKRFEFDEKTKTSRLIASYGPDAPVVAQLGGTTQSLPDERLLVSFGNGGRVEEYDASGKVVWKINGNAGYVFRAQRIRSLYEPGVGLSR